ncbi:hypothetical protein [Rhizobium sp. BR 362]|uniref:hypothetical protein n=1 Tax=Rhizobium sp. BR 362 TaxID=3040670 RepID=UPI002F415D3A
MVDGMRDDLLQQRKTLSRQVEAAKQLLADLEREDVQIVKGQVDPMVDKGNLTRNFSRELNKQIEVMADTIALMDHIIVHLEKDEPYSPKDSGASPRSSIDTNNREVIQYPEFLEGDGGPGSGG